MQATPDVLLTWHGCFGGVCTVARPQTVVLLTITSSVMRTSLAVLGCVQKWRLGHSVFSSQSLRALMTHSSSSVMTLDCTKSWRQHCSLQDRIGHAGRSQCADLNRHHTSCGEQTLHIHQHQNQVRPHCTTSFGTTNSARHASSTYHSLTISFKANWSSSWVMTCTHSAVTEKQPSNAAD